MARESRLTIGGLLLVTAGVLALSSGQAANEEIAEGLILSFAIPGFLISISGLLPGRASHPQIRMLFLPWRLVVGLAISLAGVLVVYVYYQVVHFAPVPLVIGAMLAVPLGLFYAATCWSEGCLSCGTPLEEHRTELNTEDSRGLENAVRTADLSSVLSFKKGRQPGRGVTLRLVYCAGCRGIAILEGPGGSRAVLRGDDIARAPQEIVALPQPGEETTEQDRRTRG